ncbi:glutathione hydrolase 1 proenzyme-like [Diadema antillarum]|uniref:glutathione hydrolase 1 proenzyme-like n=1 Tax=Diadema antillarum TaxID=105358 RepID=UPI003A85DA43
MAGTPSPRVLVALAAVLASAVLLPSVAGSDAGIYQTAAVATDIDICSELGRDILRQNGSAVDSAITSMLCVGVMNGESSGIGGGFFMVVYNRTNEKVEALNALETAYNATYPEMFDGQGKDGAKYGAKSVAIPGEVRGMWEAHQRYGRLPWSDLFQPVIDLARNGFRVGSHLGKALDDLDGKWDQYPTVRTMYTIREENRVAIVGDTITRPALAATLEAIAEDGPDEFYSGETAQKFVADIKNGGGLLTLADMENYRAEWIEVETLRGFSPSNLTVYSTTLTSSGPFLQFMLRTMEDFGLSGEDPISENQIVDLYHRFLEVGKFAFGSRMHLGDLNFQASEDTLENLRSREFSTFIRNLISDHENVVVFSKGSKYDIAYEVDGEDEDDSEEEGDTSHISVLAPNGDAVSVTTSVGYSFGCKHLSLSTGIVPNNHIRNFNFKTKYTSWDLLANRLAPGKRPLSTMGPSVIVDRQGNVKMVVGASGGLRIPTANAWVIFRTLFMNVPLDQAINEGRIHNHLLTNKAYYESAACREIICTKLADRGHIVSHSSSYATVQGILRTDQGIAAYSDPRKGGLAAGF